MTQGPEIRSKRYNAEHTNLEDLSPDQRLAQLATIQQRYCPCKYPGISSDLHQLFNDMRSRPEYQSLPVTLSDDSALTEHLDPGVAEHNAAAYENGS